MLSLFDCPMARILGSECRQLCIFVNDNNDDRPVDHADKGRGIILLSTSTNPALWKWLRSLEATRRSFLSSSARMY